MGLEEFTAGFAKGTDFIANGIIFWKDWSLFSQLFFYAIIGFVFITFIWVKAEVMRQGNAFNRPKRFRSKYHH